MRITISGAQGVGKSTIFKEIIKEEFLKDFSHKTEIVRSLMKRGVQINKGVDHKSQCIILEEHYKNVLSNYNLITDRCAVDALVYATWDYLNGNYTFEEHREHEELFLSCLPGYDYHFYIVPEFEMKEDGVRSVDKKYQGEIQELFVTIYKKYNIKYYQLSGSVTSRLAIFNKIIK